MKRICYYRKFGLIEITKEFDKVALISATADDIKHFACFRDYIIVNPCIDKRYNRNIYVNKLISNFDEQRVELVNLIDTKRINYDKVLIMIEEKKECRLLKELMMYMYMFDMVNTWRIELIRYRTTDMRDT